MLSIPSAQQRRRAHICFVFPALEEHRIKYFLPSFSLPTLHYNFRTPFTQLHNITREPQNTSHSLTKVWEISTAIPYICTAHLYRVKDEEHRRTKRASRTLCFVLCDTFHNTRSIITTHTTVSRFSSNIWNEHWIKKMRSRVTFRRNYCPGDLHISVIATLGCVV